MLDGDVEQRGASSRCANWLAAFWYHNQLPLHLSANMLFACSMDFDGNSMHPICTLIIRSAAIHRSMMEDVAGTIDIIVSTASNYNITLSEAFAKTRFMCLSSRSMIDGYRYPDSPIVGFDVA